MTGNPVLLSRDADGVRTLTLNRPQRRNAIDAELWVALRDALTAARDDPGVRALVLTGAGGAFCSGADVSGFVTGTHPLERMRPLTDVALLLHELPKPTVAQVTGVAVGAGWNLALGCDLVVATPGARFSQIFARRGLSIDCGGSWLLPRLVGLHQAKRLALLADMIDAAEALALGLVTWVVPAEEIDGFVTDLAARLVAGPPVALAQTKALLQEGAGRTMRDALAAEARAQAVNFASTDVPEGYAAFTEKRTPTFTGQWAVTTQRNDDPPTRSGPAAHQSDDPTAQSGPAAHQSDDAAAQGGPAAHQSDDAAAQGGPAAYGNDDAAARSGIVASRSDAVRSFDDLAAGRRDVAPSRNDVSGSRNDQEGSRHA